MAINKKALARAIVPYVYEEAENQGLTTNSGSERLSIEGEIEDPSGESDGLYVEATVKCSCDRDFPMDKNTGWRDSAEAKSLSYKVLDATVYDDDDQDIDVTDELQSALSWPDTYGPKKGLKEGWDDDDYEEGDWAEDELDPDDPLITTGADAIGADIFEKNGNVVAGKVYSGKITSTFGSEFDTGEYDEFTITYRVKAVKVGKNAWYSHFKPIKITVNGEGVRNVDITKEVDDYWSSINAMHSDDESLNEAASPKEIIGYNIQQYGDEIIEDVVRRLRKKYPDYHIGLQDLDDSDLRLRGRINGDLGEHGKETITYDVMINDMDSLSVFGIVVLWNKVTVTLDGKTVDITDDLKEKFTGEDWEEYWDAYVYDDSDLDESKEKIARRQSHVRGNPDKTSLNEEMKDLNYEEILEAILDNVCEKLEAKYPDYNDSYDVDIDDEDMSTKGIVKGLFGGDRELTVKYVVNLDSVDEIQPYGISGTISRAIVIENGKSRDITDQMQDLGW